MAAGRAVEAVPVLLARAALPVAAPPRAVQVHVRLRHTPWPSATRARRGPGCRAAVAAVVVVVEPGHHRVAKQHTADAGLDKVGWRRGARMVVVVCVVDRVLTYKSSQ